MALERIQQKAQLLWKALKDPSMHRMTVMLGILQLKRNGNAVEVVKHAKEKTVGNAITVKTW